jgi:hypothetical protein
VSSETPLDRAVDYFIIARIFSPLLAYQAVAFFAVGACFCDYAATPMMDLSQGSNDCFWGAERTLAKP